jgi:hypothetical protein
MRLCCSESYGRVNNTLLLLIREIPGADLGPEMAVVIDVFVVYFSTLPGKCRFITSNNGT